MKILVTGATGLIGCHAAAALVEAGHTVRLLVRDPGKLEAVFAPFGRRPSDFELVIGSIRNKHGVSEKMVSDAMVANQNDPAVQAKVVELREAMNGKAPPGYTPLGYGVDSEPEKAANQRRRSGRGRGKR